MIRRFLVVTVLVLSFLAVSSAQQKPSSEQKEPDSKNQQDVVKLSVTLVQVDAVVTDKSGKIVTDLKSEDFEIYEDGRPQQIRNFSFVSTQSASTAAPAAAPKPTGNPATVVPPSRLRPEQVQRTIALVVDDLNLSFTSIEPVRYNLRKFVDEQMQPGDLVAILRAGSGMGALQQFTSDKRLLYAAIDRVQWNTRGWARPGVFEAEGALPPSPAKSPRSSMTINGDKTGGDEEIDDFREQIFKVGLLGSLQYVVSGLRDLPGRKSVIIFSQGFQFSNKSTDRIFSPVSRLIDMANRASVVIYAIDPRGIVPIMMDAQDIISVTRAETAYQNRRYQLFESQGGLEYMAAETGGFMIANTNDLPGGIRRVMEDQKGYYLLGYVPSQATFKSLREKPAYHKISIKVKRAGLSVRSRNGFLGITDEEARPKQPSPLQRLSNALTSPFTASAINLRLTSLFGNDPQKGPYIRSLLHINTRDLTFTEEQDGSRKATFDIAAFTFGDNGTVVDQIVQTYSLKVSKENFDKAMRDGIVYKLNLPIKKSGAYQLRTAIHDLKSEQVGSASEYIEVPDVNKGRLTLSGIALSGDSLLDTPAPATVQDASGSAETSSQASPAVRKFRPGSDLNYIFSVYNAKLAQANSLPNLSIQLALWRDGKRIFLGPPATLQLSQQNNWKSIPITGSLKLTNKIQPGEYVFQVLITDNTAREKYRQATQWMSFEIVQ